MAGWRGGGKLTVGGLGLGEMLPPFSQRPQQEADWGLLN